MQSHVSFRRRLLGATGTGWAQCREDIKAPAPLGPSIDELGAPLDGLQCAEEDCDFITVNQDGLRKHRKSVHNLAWSAKDSTAYTEVKVQTFFQKSVLRRYFLVDARDNNNNDPCIPREVIDAIKERLAEWQLRYMLKWREPSIHLTAIYTTSLRSRIRVMVVLKYKETLVLVAWVLARITEAWRVNVLSWGL
jgi:hypothetical protein